MEGSLSYPMLSLNRREFIFALATSACGFAAIDNKRFLIGDGFQKAGSHFDIQSFSNPGSLVISNGKGFEKIPCSFLPHFITFHPGEPTRVFAFEKWGRNAAEFNLKTKEVIREFKAPIGRRYFGHGVAGLERGKVFASQMDDTHQMGLLVELGGREFSTHGTYPHDCQWSLDKKDILVLNAHEHSKTSSSSLVWLDPTQGKLKKQISLQNTDGGYAHFAQLPGGEIVVGGAGEKKPLLTILQKDKVSPFELPDHLRGEALSLYTDEKTQTLFVSFPTSNEVHAWNYKTRTHLRKFRVLEARAIVNWNGDVLFSSSRDKNWVDSTQTTLFRGGSGSHATLL